MAIKLDTEKTYDRLERTFIKDALITKVSTINGQTESWNVYPHNYVCYPRKENLGMAST